MVSNAKRAIKKSEAAGSKRTKAKPERLNPMQRALAQADDIIAANNELERLSRPALSSSAPVVTHADTFTDRRNDDPAKPAVDPAIRARVGKRQSDMALGIGEFAPKKKSRTSGNTI